MSIDPIIPITASLVLSYVFVVASMHKWQHIEEFRTTLINYKIVPENRVGAFIYSIPTIELLCGIALLIPYSARIGAFVAAALLLMYMFAIGINLLRGRRTIDCGCGGSEQKQAINEGILFRNGILLFFSYSIATAVQSRGFVWLDWVVVLLATATGCLFYNIINQLLVNKDLLKVLKSHYG